METVRYIVLVLLARGAVCVFHGACERGAAGVEIAGTLCDLQLDQVQHDHQRGEQQSLDQLHEGSWQHPLQPLPAPHLQGELCRLLAWQLQLPPHLLCDRGGVWQQSSSRCCPVARLRVSSFPPFPNNEGLFFFFFVFSSLVCRLKVQINKTAR